MLTRLFAILKTITVPAPTLAGAAFGKTHW